MLHPTMLDDVGQTCWPRLDKLSDRQYRKLMISFLVFSVKM